MTERLDQMEALLLMTTERLNQTAEQQQRNTTNIDNLLGTISTTDREVRALAQTVAANVQRFDVLRADAIADREENRQRFEVLSANSIADREENRRRFDARHEVIQSLLITLQGSEE